MPQATVQTDAPQRSATSFGASVAQLTLTILQGPGAGRRVGLPPRLEPYVIGRAAEAHVQIDHETVSRAHVELRVGPSRAVGEPASVLLVDRGSTNGTWVNGKRVGEVALHPGSRVQLGEIVLRLDALERTDPLDAEPGVASTSLASFEDALASISLVYQPIVRWVGRRTEGWEALLRTVSTELPTPLALLDAAKYHGRLWQLGRAARALAADTAAHAPPGTRIYVNVHPDDLGDDVLYDTEGPLARVADRVVLEITERSSLDIVERFDDRLGQLRALGFRLAIDDLGAGYSGLTSLARVRPDVVKVDMDLVRGVDADATKRSLLRSVVDLCHELGAELVAEGVETEGERDTVVALGCELLQGFGISRPAPGLASALL